MINKKKISALLLSGAILSGLGQTVFATTQIPTIGNGTELSEAKAPITKSFEFAEGLEIPSVKFDFIATKITSDAPSAKITSVDYSKNDLKGDLKNNLYKVEKQTEIKFDKKFPHAGVYEYNVKETQGDSVGVTYDKNEYKIRVYVANGEKGTFIEYITAENGGNKKPIKFVNTYKKDASLVVGKTIAGKMADKTKKFNFNIIFTKSATSDSNQIEGNIVDKQGEKTPVTINIGENKGFNLGDGEKLEFNKIPVGTRYKVTEVGVAGDGYTPSINVVENGKKTVIEKGNEENDLSSSTNGTNLVGENENKVTFVNTHNETPITGIITNNLPFVLMIGVATLGFGALAVLKRRKTLR